MTATTTEGVLPVGVELVEEDVPHYLFDAEFQQKIAALVIRDTPFAQLTDGLIRPEYFENGAFSALVKIATEYYSKYKKAPGDKTTIGSLIKDAAARKSIPPEFLKIAIGALPSLWETDVSDRDYVADACATFARHQAVSKAILDSVELMDKRDFDGISSKMQKALNVGISSQAGSYDYADMVQQRSQERRDRLAGIRPPSGVTTGYKVLDDSLFHAGWGRKELSVLMGPAKSGKSMALISFGINAAAAGYKTLYVTLEVASSIIATRMDANIAERAMSELAINLEEVEEKVILFTSKSAPFIMHESPTGTLRPSDLSRLLEHHKSQGLVFDLVIVDYADLMAPERVTDSITENSKSVYVNLRAIAMRENIALLTATQTNREGAKKAVATMTDVAEDFNKIRIADIIISINVSPEEKALGQARLFMAACRNQRSGYSIRVEQKIDQAKFISRVIGED